MVVATTRIISRINAIEFVAANPLGTFGVTPPVTCNIIPIKPMIKPPATRPKDKIIQLTVYGNLES